MMNGNPAEATSGALSLAYYVKITVASAASSQKDGSAVRDLLECRFTDAPVPGFSGAQVTGVIFELPPGGAERFVVGVTAHVDLTRWNSERETMTGQKVAEYLGEVLSQTDVSSVDGASIDDVELKMLISAPG